MADMKKHAMKVFRDATKDDCEDEELKKQFDMIRDYNSLNKWAIKVFNFMSNSGIGEEAKELFKPRRESAVLPDVAIFTIVIRAYVCAGKSKAAHKVYQRMIAAGVAPTSCTYSLLITSLGRDSASDVSFVGYAKKYFLEMLEKGMKPSSVSYVAVFNAIACRETVEKGREFLALIKAKGFSPESNFYYSYTDVELTVVMNAIKMNDDLVNKNTDKEMQKVLRKYRTAGGRLQKESMEMFAALVEDGRVDQVKEFCKYDFEKGLYPQVVVDTCLIKDYLKAGKTKVALEAYLTMLATGGAPNSYTYTVLIKGLTVDPNFCGDAKKCLLDMMDRGMRPNAATYTAVIEGFARQEDKAAEEEGKELVEIMMSKGFVPNAKAMMEVLKGRPTPVIRRVLHIVLSKLKG
ncbi:hypothetical protein M0R45_027306 [Rubus argutus]|uniref:Pentatricopeptide n=1 Tax=Rubus argutus TaxID=59490 RepID=A0AAW1X075_RUBAR